MLMTSHVYGLATAVTIGLRSSSLVVMPMEPNIQSQTPTTQASTTDPDAKGAAADSPQRSAPLTAGDFKEPWWWTAFRAAPFKATSIMVLTVGGLMLLMFFVRLGTMPDLDFASATASMAAVAVLGLLVITLTGGSTIVAGLVTRGLFDRSLPNSILFDHLALLAAPGIVTAIWLLVTDFGAHGPSVGHILVGGLALMLLLVTLRLRVPWTPVTHTDTDQRRELVKHVLIRLSGRLMVGFVWFLSTATAIVMLIVTWSAERQTTGLSFDVTVIIWCLLCAGLNGTLVMWPGATLRAESLGVVFLAAFGFFGLTVFSENWTAVPAAAVRTLGLGDLQVGVVVSEEGCDTFNKASRGQTVCQLDAEHRSGWVCPVILQSRIGSPFVFELTSFNERGGWPARQRSAIGALDQAADNDQQLRRRLIHVAKSEVRSWSRVEPLRLSTPPKDGNGVLDRFHVVTYLDGHQLSATAREQSSWLARQCGAPHVVK